MVDDAEAAEDEEEEEEAAGYRIKNKNPTPRGSSCTWKLRPSRRHRRTKSSAAAKPPSRVSARKLAQNICTSSQIAP